MFSFRPLRKKKTGRWDYAVLDHFGNAEPCGCCAEYYLNGHTEGHHATRDEAVKAFKEFIYDKLMMDASTFVAGECVVCKEKTFFGCAFEHTKNEPPIFIMHLCKQHMTKDNVLCAITDQPFYSANETFDCEERSDVDPNNREWESE